MNVLVKLYHHDIKKCNIDNIGVKSAYLFLIILPYFLIFMKTQIMPIRKFSFGEGRGER